MHTSRRSNAGLRLGRLELSTGFLLSASILLYLDTENILPLVAAAAGLHELGHLCAAVFAGGRVRCLRVTLTGCCMELDPRCPLSYQGELFVILSGPAVNLLLAITAVHLPCQYRDICQLFSGISLILGGVNLLPVYPLDGGRLLRLVLTAFFTPDRAAVLIRVCSLIFATLFLLGEVWLVLHGEGSPVACFAGAWLMAGAFRGQWT